MDLEYRGDDDVYLTYLPFNAAADTIRDHLKSYVGATAIVARRGLNSAKEKFFGVTTTSDEMESAIVKSREILNIEIDLDEGISTKYLEETWNRSVRLASRDAEPFLASDWADFTCSVNWTRRGRQH